jgi:gliding motility-associated-like protein
MFGSFEVYTFEIYNRFGQKIFTTANFTKNWNGTFNGKNVDMGTYVWFLKAKNKLTNTMLNKKGTLVVIR